MFKFMDRALFLLTGFVLLWVLRAYLVEPDLFTALVVVVALAWPLILVGVFIYAVVWRWVRKKSRQ